MPYAKRWTVSRGTYWNIGINLEISAFSVIFAPGTVLFANRTVPGAFLLVLANKAITKAGNTGYLPKTTSILSDFTNQARFHHICIPVYFTDIILSTDRNDEFTNFFIGYPKGSIVVKIKHSLRLRQWCVNKNCKFVYRKF